MQFMQQDPRVLEIFLAAQGMDVSTADDLLGKAGGDESAKPSAPPKPKEEPKKEAPPLSDNRTPAQKEADDFKNEANKLYKEKKFQEAIAMYEKAIEKEPNDLTYHNNKAAVYV